MTTAKQAEEYVKRYFKEIRRIDLGSRGRGFDFRDESSNRFVEVKGSREVLSGLQGCSFTNPEYEKAKSCRREKAKYEIHLVVGIGRESQVHYEIPVKVFLDQAKPVISWDLTFQKKDFHNYILEEGKLIS